MIDIERSLPKKENFPEVDVPKPPIGIGFNVDTPLPKAEPEAGKETEKVESAGSRIGKKILLWIRDIAMAVLVAILIMQFVRPTIVQQHSMEDTLHENDYIFLNRQAYNFGEVKRGDIFVFKYDPPLTLKEQSKNLIKRVIGLPGDVVSIDDGNVYVNDKITDESYTKDGYTSGHMDPMEVPEGYIFALGDNRQNSLDSRDPMVGFIDMGDIIGKAVFRVYPFKDAGPVN